MIRLRWSTAAVSVLLLFLPLSVVSAGEIRLMTWNLKDMDLFDGNGTERISWQLESERGIAETIRRVNPDLLFFTEAPSFVELEAFVSRQNLEYEILHFRQQSGRRDYADGMAILHRLNLRQASLVTPVHTDSGRPEQSAYIDWSYRGLVVAEFEGFHVVGVHLKSPWDGKERSYRIRDSQVRTLLDYIDTITGPLVVIGDFNDSPGRDSKETSFGIEDTIAVLETELLRAAGAGVTQEKGFNLDHIMVRDAAIGSRTVESTDWLWSDHRPVWADLLIPGVP